MSPMYFSLLFLKYPRRICVLSIICCLGCTQQEDPATVFDAYGLEGSSLIYNYQTQAWTNIQNGGTDQASCPASTFKILNSLIALEEQIVADEQEVFAWDGQQRSIAAWNQDANMDRGFKYSVVWFYQELARRIGRERYQDYLQRCAYGNQTIGDQIDLFWLDGSLAISPRQQVEFLINVYERSLPFSARSYNILNTIMLDEQTDSYTIHAKSGWAQIEGKNIGWWIGYVRVGEKLYFFATRLWKDMDQPSDNFAQSRKAITMEILRKLNMIPDN